MRPLHVVVIAGTSPILTQALSLLLAQQPDIQVAGTAPTGSSLHHLLEQYAPHVALTGPLLDYPDYASLTRTIKAAHPQTGLVLFGAHQPEQIILAAIAAGAEGFVPFCAPLPELLHTIRVVCAGGHCYSPEINRSLSRALRSIRKQQEQDSTVLQMLTTKEQQVLTLICQGFTTKDICTTMKLMPGTVHTHRKNLLAKTGAKNVAGLVFYAVKEGIVPISAPYQSI